VTYTVAAISPHLAASLSKYKREVELSELLNQVKQKDFILKQLSKKTNKKFCLANKRSVIICFARK
jgi:hypothetical protein